MDKFISLAEKLDFKYALNEPMSRHTSMKVGGNADFAVFPKSDVQIAQIVKLAKKENVKLTVLGNGSNVLVSDNGLRGVTMILGKDFSKVKYLGDGVIFAQAGAMLTKLCRTALDLSLSGLEFAFGIPGSCGGAAFMNAGAYGGEMKDVLIKCTHVTPDGEIGELSAEELDLSYRHSVYEDNGCIVTGVFVKLREDDKKSIEEKMTDFMTRRKTKQPLEYPSAGSTFKRPEGYFAGALIEECSLKGKQIGGAQVSEKHAGFLINIGNATCEDFKQLIDYIKETVLKEKGVELETEVRFLD